MADRYSLGPDIDLNAEEVLDSNSERITEARAEEMAEHWMTRGRDNSTLIYGRTDSGRHLFIVAVDDGGDAFVVTARDMSPAEKKTFNKKAR